MCLDNVMITDDDNITRRKKLGIIDYTHWKHCRGVLPKLYYYSPKYMYKIRETRHLVYIIHATRLIERQTIISP